MARKRKYHLPLRRVSLQKFRVCQDTPFYGKWMFISYTQKPIIWTTTFWYGTFFNTSMAVVFKLQILTKTKGDKIICSLKCIYDVTVHRGQQHANNRVRTLHQGRQRRVSQNEKIENAYICDSRNRRGQQSQSAQQFVYPWCTLLLALKPLVLVPTFSTNKMTLPSSTNTLRVCEITNWISYYRASLSFLQCMVEVVIQQSIVCITTFCQDAYSFLLLLLSIY